jgi:hypothetical protein
MESDNTGEKASRPPISLLYCHFAHMGGLVVDVSEIHDFCNRFVLTPGGLVELARRGHLIEIADERIRELDHYDYLGKGIAIMQAFWIVLQCIGRKAAGLPISLLELNTCVNVGLAFCLRQIWSQKPFDVSNYIIVKDTAFRDVIAMMLMESTDAKGRFSQIYAECVHVCVYEESGRAMQSGSQGSPKILTHIPISRFSGSDLLWRTHVLPNEIEAKCTLASGQALESGAGPSFKYSVYEKYELSSKDILRWNLAAFAFKKDVYLGYRGSEEDDWINNGPTGTQGVARKWRQMIHSNSLSVRAVNVALVAINSTYWVQANDLVDVGLNPRLMSLLSLFLAAHGGIHLSAWNFSFPTRPEMLFWRLACFGLTLGFIPIALAAWLVRFASGYIGPPSWSYDPCGLEYVPF